jgi:DNA-binding CsgD family transcriptional regulator
MMNIIENTAITRLKKIECRIVEDISAGLSTNEIARKQNITSGTVRNYVSSILHKTGLQHRTQIAIYTIQNGLNYTPYLQLKSHAGGDSFVQAPENSSLYTRNPPEETT